MTSNYSLGELAAGAQHMTVLLSAQKAAELLGLSPRTLANWRWRGGDWGPPFVKVGRSVRYNLRELLNWISENSFSSTSEADGNR